MIERKSDLGATDVTFTLPPGHPSDGMALGIGLVGASGQHQRVAASGCVQHRRVQCCGVVGA